eukprot:gene16621-biopygen9802
MCDVREPRGPAAAARLPKGPEIERDAGQHPRLHRAVHHRGGGESVRRLAVVMDAHGSHGCVRQQEEETGGEERLWRFGSKPLGEQGMPAPRTRHPRGKRQRTRTGRGPDTGRAIEFEETDADRTRTGRGRGRFSQAKRCLQPAPCPRHARTTFLFGEQVKALRTIWAASGDPPATIILEIVSPTRVVSTASPGKAQCCNPKIS